MSEPIPYLLLCGVLSLAASVPVYAQELRDPTRPGGWQPAVAERVEFAREDRVPLHLQGMFSVAGARSVMINGRRVAIGDRVAGAEVVEIGPDTVVLDANGRRLELAYQLSAVKAPVEKTEEEK